MEPLTLHLWTCDVGTPSASAEDFARLLTGRVLESWAEGADIVVFPEFSWLGAERFMEGPDRVAGVARWFWGRLWPEMRVSLARPDKAVVLGTVPFADADGRLFNRAPILAGGREIFQDKLHLTPWESVFSAGEILRVWEFRGLRVAVLVCLDVEVPELAVALRRAEVDLLLVPSATENVLGMERVGRCADARAVELGCQVALCPLVGRAESALVDENIGRLALFSPSQSPFAERDRRVVGDVLTDGFHRLAVGLDPAAVWACRDLPEETVPARLRPGGMKLEIEHNIRQ